MESLPISVIIITKNAETSIEECLRAVESNNPAEIIIVDGNSSDRTVEIARRYTPRIYSDEGRGGRSYARQLGAEKATQEYIAYIDSDAILLTDKALATMLAEFQGSDYIHIAAQLAPGMKCATYWEWAQYQHNLLHQAIFSSKRGVGLTAGLFRRETILKYGFDLAYGGVMDDMALELRLRRDGYKFGTSSAQIYPRFRTDLKSLIRHWFFQGKTASWYIRRYGIWHARLWPPLGVFYWLGFCLIKGKLKLIPFEIIDGAARTAGMVKGFFELLRR